MATATEGAMKTLPITKVKIREGFNPRDEYDQAGIDELVKSIKRDGVIVPIILNPDHQVIDGHRRVIAASAAGLKEIPYIVEATGDEREQFEVATITSVQREGLTPLQEARAIERLDYTEKQAMEAFGKSRAWVKARMALLNLPDDLQHKVSAGELPLAAVEILGKMPKGLQRLIAAFVEGEIKEAKDNGYTPEHDWATFVEEPVTTAWEAEQSSDTEVKDWERDFVLASERGGPTYHNQDLATFIQDDTVIERWEQLEQVAGYSRYDRGARFGQDDIDAAKSYGCLVELEEKIRYGDGKRKGYVITDGAFIEDRVKQFVDQLEKDVEKRAKEQAKAEKEAKTAGASDKAVQAAKEGKSKPKGVTDKEWEAVQQIREKEERAKERAAEQAHREEVHAGNLDYGAKLMKGIVGSGKITKRQAQIIAGVTLAAIDPLVLAKRGMRYIEPKLQERYETKGGKPKLDYWPDGPSQKEQIPDAGTWVSDWIMAGKNAEDILGRLLVAVLACQVEEPVANSKRAFGAPSLTKGGYVRNSADAAQASDYVERVDVEEQVRAEATKFAPAYLKDRLAEKGGVEV